jgi:hypothetical protein
LPVRFTADDPKAIAAAANADHKSVSRMDSQHDLFYAELNR